MTTKIRALEHLAKNDGQDELIAKALADAKAKREQHLAAKRAARPKGIQLQQLDAKLGQVEKRIKHRMEESLPKLAAKTTS